MPGHEFVGEVARIGDRAATRGDFPFADPVTHRFALDDVSEAFDTISRREGEVLKVVLDPTLPRPSPAAPTGASA
ncbi:hypothetical protein [Glaciibacter psychrotolerans]|uniref:Threonine dehydrogenase-like Zn-dependent dehydrogenase n=1 Tax=Glaciibacter psychrotolerans TaxID=670054 RepID=A0A7Z0EG79_9MICO|nr:hypothetical protein [Leifsonia psychrotolerans]NYJ20354.1 threonine dehydrogenase-like Zn-dependent dehydrogenase [Leifsonia psychrotolerans]